MCRSDEPGGVSMDVEGRVSLDATTYHLIKNYNYLLHDILTSNQDSSKNTKVETILVVDPHWQLPQWVSLKDIAACFRVSVSV